MRFVHGSMRLATVQTDDERALATLASALAAGFTTFDTAHAYGRDEADLGRHERLLGRAVGHLPVTIVTKCGMRRDAGAWIADGRASRILEDARRSCEALGRPPDVLLLHAPDRRVSFATSVRALVRAKDQGLAKTIGVSNVTRKQLAAALDLAPISAVQCALGAHDTAAIRGGVLALAIERGLTFYAHAPLGGPERAARLARDATLRSVHCASTLEIFLAYLLAVHPAIRPVVGAHRPETIASLARAASLRLDDDTLRTLDARFPILGALRRPPPRAPTTGAEVVILMGIPGAGKSRSAAAYVERGYERLNRDLLGGTLRSIAQRLDGRLGAGGKRFVLDNTYVTRAVRTDVVRVAQAHGAAVRCVFFDTPRHEAERNVLARMIARLGRLVDPAERNEDPVALGPLVVARMVRDLEPPEPDEGFAAIETIPFVREPDLRATTPALVIVLGTTIDDGAVRAALDAHPSLPVLFIAARARPDDALHDYVRRLERDAELAICPHVVGPIACWCRPPQLGLFAEFAARRLVDIDRSVIVRAGSSRSG